MRDSLRRLAKELAPPLLVRTIRRSTKSAFQGNYSDWRDAELRCGDAYRNPSLIDDMASRTRALIAAQSSRYLNQRNARLLVAVQAALLPHLSIASEPTIIDFGGSMGGHYFSLRRFLPAQKLHWVVVELPETASTGTRLFSTDELNFVKSLDDAPRSAELILASGALQYCSEPFSILARLAETRPKSPSHPGGTRLILDRLPLWRKDDRICVQTIRSSSFCVSTPARFFSDSGFRANLKSFNWTEAMTWDVPEDTVVVDSESVIFSGMACLRTRIGPVEER